MMTNYDRLYADITSKRYPTGLVVKYVGVNSPYVLLGTFDGVGHPNVSKRQNTERDAAGNPRVYYQPRIASNRSVLATISFNQKGKVVQVREVMKKDMTYAHELLDRKIFTHAPAAQAKFTGRQAEDEHKQWLIAVWENATGRKLKKRSRSTATEELETEDGSTKGDGKTKRTKVTIAGDHSQEKKKKKKKKKKTKGGSQSRTKIGEKQKESQEVTGDQSDEDGPGGDDDLDEFGLPRVFKSARYDKERFPAAYAADRWNAFATGKRSGEFNDPRLLRQVRAHHLLLFSTPAPPVQELFKIYESRWEDPNHPIRCIKITPLWREWEYRSDDSPHTVKTVPAYDRALKEMEREMMQSINQDVAAKSNATPEQTTPAAPVPSTDADIMSLAEAHELLRPFLFNTDAVAHDPAYKKAWEAVDRASRYENC